MSTVKCCYLFLRARDRFLPQHQIQLVDNFSPVSVFKMLLTQKSRLGGRPEKSIFKLEVRLEWRVGGDKLFDVFRAGRQAQLLEQGWQAMGWLLDRVDSIQIQGRIGRQRRSNIDEPECHRRPGPVLCANPWELH